MSCLFCKIANNEIKSDIVYQDERVVAFNDINPKAPHHVLIIPRKHIATLNDVENSDTQLLGYCLQIAKNIAAERNIAEKGYRVLINCNADGGQAVYHIHVHLMGGRAMMWPPG